MLNCAEHETSFITSGPGWDQERSKLLKVRTLDPDVILVPKPVRVIGR